jgi:hypothetical protein
VYENGTMRPIETIPRMGVGRIKGNGGQQLVNFTLFCQHNNNIIKIK